MQPLLVYFKCLLRFSSWHDNENSGGTFRDGTTTCLRPHCNERINKTFRAICKVPKPTHFDNELSHSRYQTI